MADDEPDVRERLVQLFDDIQVHAQSHTAAGLDRPLVVLVSRRMTCAYTLLLRTGEARDLEADGIDVYSDRTLEGTPPDCTNRLVYVADDSLARGTTLKNRVDTVVRLGASPALVHVRVACVDDERALADIVDEMQLSAAGEEGPPRWPSKRVQEFSLELARMLYAGGIPYFADFPVTVPFTLSDDQWQALVSSSRWLIADVTPPIAGGPGSFSFIPHEATLTSLAETVFEPIWELASLFKVRMLRFETGKCVAIPLGLVGGASGVAIEAALEGLTGRLRERSGKPRQFHAWRSWETAAKQRVLQMYLASALLSEFWLDIQNTGIGHILTRSMLEQDGLNSYFGSDLASALDAFDLVASGRSLTEPQTKNSLETLGTRSISLPSPIWENDKLRTRVALSRELVYASGVPSRPSAGEIVKVDPAFCHSILSVFGFITQRIQSRDDFDAEIDVDSYGPIDEPEETLNGIRRMGVTMRELEEVLLPEVFNTNDVWHRSVLSLAIDVGNDLGIAVPTTFHDRSTDVVVRQYRTGENSGLVDVPLEMLQKSRRRPDKLVQLYVGSSSDPKRLAKHFRHVGASGILEENLVYAFHGQVDERRDRQVHATVWSLIEASSDDDKAVFSSLEPEKLRALAPGALFEWIVERQSFQLVRSKISSEIRPII